MKKIIIFSVIFFSLLFFPIISHAQENPATEYISDFSSYIIVRSNGSMQVTETIKVHAENLAIKHGIYRDFPTRYKDKLGNNFVVDFKVESVKKDGLGEGYHLESLNNGVRIYMGDENAVISPGDYTYELVYDTNRQLGFFADHDELYWNVTGNGWNFPIYKVTANVVLPFNINEVGNLTTDGYMGSSGEKDKDFKSEVNGNGIVFSTTRSLSNYEGLTIVVGWPKGLILEPTKTEKTKLLLRDNEGLLFVFGGLLIVILYFFITWFKKGKDPKKGTIIPFYDAPEGFSPAQIGYIYKMGYSSKDFTAAIINMAIKGYVKIDKTGSAYKLIKIGNNETSLAPEELEIGRNIFAAGNEIELKNSNFTTISLTTSALSQNLRQQFGTKYFSIDAPFYAIGFAIALVAFAVSTYFYPQLIILFAIIYIIIAIIFYKLFKKPTGLGRKYMDEMDGFKWFLSVTEKERMNFHNPPEKTPELFENFLPYALVLGVDNKWGRQFTEVFNRLHDQGRDYVPAWYLGANFAAADFASSFGHSFSSAISSASTPPGSNSGFGGGFSGGGGGGGGGGGW
ncbi:MAG: DUF2207 domain-containing protein [Candidatus Buchananbacteria bacterium]